MKNVLFVTYFWPPSGKATLHWPLGVIRHLPEFGYQPLVLTADEDTFTQKDKSLLNKVDPKLHVIKAKTLEPFSLYRRFLGKEKDAPLVASETISTTNKSLRHQIAVWLRLNLFIPDARIGWYWNAVRAGKRLLQTQKIDAIVSIGPPHTTLLVGKKLSSLFCIPHIPVLIDPWVDISYYRGLNRSKIAVAIDRNLEKSVLEQAANIIFVTESMKEDYTARYPQVQNKSHVLYWGYDERLFYTYSPKQTTNEEILLHAGNIYDHQNPKELWSTLKREINNGRNLKIVFVGTVAPAIKNSVQEAGLLDRTEYKGFLPYEQMLEKIGSASYLLVCASEKRHVPGKLFEYLRSGKPIIAFGDENEEVGGILEKANAGMLFHLNANGKEFFSRAKEFNTDNSYVKQFDRKEIAKKLSVIIS